jgi:hypothetical protein
MKYAICVGLLLCLGVLTSLGEVDYGALTEEEKAEMDQQMKAMFRSIFIGDIAISGTVEDDQGNPLDDVKVAVYLKQNGEHRFVTNVSHGFQLSYTNATVLSLSFSKDGFYSESMTYTINADLAASPSGRRIISHDDVVVRLGEIGEAFDLQESGFRCSYSTSEESFGAHAADDGMNRYAITNFATLRANTFYLTAATNQNGIVITNVPAVLRRGKNVPADLVVNVYGEDAGVQRYVPMDAEATYSRIIRDMQTAPDEGYADSIHLIDGEREVYLYYKICGCFGKGYVRRASGVTHEGTKVELLFKCLTQTNGTRNVRSPQ